MTQYVHSEGEMCADAPPAEYEAFYAYGTPPKEANYRKQIFITQKVGLYYGSNGFHFSVQYFLETFVAVIDI